MIPMNVVDIDAINKATAAKFAGEVDALENYVFSKKWESTARDTPVTPYIRVSWLKELTVKNAAGEKETIYLGDDHWKLLVDHAKSAGYCVYLEWYHNGYYGETSKRCLYITRTPFTRSELERMELLPEWGTAWGPGRECYRGERL